MRHVHAVDRDPENEAFYRNDLTDDEEFKSILCTFSLLRPVQSC